MRVRIRFSKTGAVKYVGHLDMMRYFQKAIRRAGLDICYSEGFSPHQIMSFAAPLGVGMESTAEYFDIEVHTSLSSDESVRILNEQMADGIEVLSYVQLPEDAGNCMSVTQATDYDIRFRKGHGEFLFSDKLEEGIRDFLRQETIIVRRAVKPKNKQKKKRGSEPAYKETDIRPLILNLSCTGDIIFARLSSASGNSLNTRVLLDALCGYLGYPYGQDDFAIVRREVYFADQDGRLLPLENAGSPIE